MKSLFIVLSLIWMTNASLWAQKGYLIPYNGGLDSLKVFPGDVIPDVIGRDYIAFSTSQFWKDSESIDGIYAYSSHGFKFFGRNIQLMEDTLNEIIKVFHLEICADPNDLLAENVVVQKDERTLGDSSEYVDHTVSFWLFVSGIIFVLIFFIVKIVL